MTGKNNTGIEKKLQNFLEMPGEEVILYTREHWIFLLRNFMSILIITVIFSFISLFVLAYFHTLLLFTPVILSLLAFLFSAITKICIDWYFHIYLITTHKLMEIFYSPFFLYKTNTILLDQVRCTEIDEGKQGILEEVFDFGNITLTFDRPTHSEEFVLQRVGDPTHIAITLRNFLTSSDQNQHTLFYQTTKPTFFRKRISYA